MDEVHQRIADLEQRLAAFEVRLTAIEDKPISDQTARQERLSKTLDADAPVNKGKPGSQNGKPRMPARAST